MSRSTRTARPSCSRSTSASRAPEQRPGTAFAHGIRIAVDSVELDASLAIPHGACGIVLCAHVHDGARLDRRSRITSALHSKGLATLLLDLLTTDEQRDRQHCDIGVLAERLVEAADWVVDNPGTHHLRVGYLGTMACAAAALVAAAERPDIAGAVVSTGGRPERAGPVLPIVQAPTLLILGTTDPRVAELNRAAIGRLKVEARLEIVPPAAVILKVAELAGGWFVRYLGPRPVAI